MSRFVPQHPNFYIKSKGQSSQVLYPSFGIGGDKLSAVDIVEVHDPLTSTAFDSLFGTPEPPMFTPACLLIMRQVQRLLRIPC